MISACMTVSVRELRTAVREWACCTCISEIGHCMYIHVVDVNKDRIFFLFGVLRPAKHKRR